MHKSFVTISLYFLIKDDWMAKAFLIALSFGFLLLRIWLYLLKMLGIVVRMRFGELEPSSHWDWFGHVVGHYIYSVVRRSGENIWS